MALIKCAECGKEVSSNAKTCPNCGNKMPKKTSLATWIAGGIFLVAVVTCSLNIQKSNEESETSEAKRLAALTPAQRTAEIETKKNLETLHSAQYICEDAVKKTLHDPDSAQFDPSESYAILPGTKPPNHFSMLVTVRAKNGFGALRHIAIRCDLTRKSPAEGWVYTIKEMS